MRLSTIWDLSINFTMRERFRRTYTECFVPWLANRLPKRLRYQVLINEGVKSIENHETVPEVPYTDVLQRTGDRLAIR